MKTQSLVLVVLAGLAAIVAVLFARRPAAVTAAPVVTAVAPSPGAPDPIATAAATVRAGSAFVAQLGDVLGLDFDVVY